MQDGGIVGVDWYMLSERSIDSNTPIVIFFPGMCDFPEDPYKLSLLIKPNLGLNGHSNSGYVCQCAIHLQRQLKQNIQCAAFTYRGTNGLDLLVKFYSSIW